MNRRRRFQSIWLIFTFAWLTLISVAVIGNLAKGAFHPSGEWAVFPMLAALWAFAIHFLQSYLKPAAPIAGGGSPVAESFRAALVSIRKEQANLKLVAILFVILIPLTVVAVGQLEAAGKISPRELRSMVVFFGSVFLASGAGIAIWYFGRLAPRRRTLETLVGELNESDFHA
jgi:hypothetical protein